MWLQWGQEESESRSRSDIKPSSIVFYNLPGQSLILFHPINYSVISKQSCHFGGFLKGFLVAYHNKIQLLCIFSFII